MASVKQLELGSFAYLEGRCIITWTPLRLGGILLRLTFSSVPRAMKGRKMDPIFAVDGALTFNWWYSNNGVRIGNSKAYCGSGLPVESVDADNYFGIGNTIAGKTKIGEGHHGYRCDVGV